MTEQNKRHYEPNPKTPLDRWSEDIDPAIMSGQHWEEEENAPLEADVGWASEENEDWKETNIPPAGEMFMHPTHDVSYGRDTLERQMDAVSKDVAKRDAQKKQDRRSEK